MYKAIEIELTRTLIVKIEQDMPEGSWQAWTIYLHEGVDDLKYHTLKKVLFGKLTPLKNVIIKNLKYPCISIIFKIKIDS